MSPPDVDTESADKDTVLYQVEVSLSFHRLCTLRPDRATAGAGWCCNVSTTDVAHSQNSEIDRSVCGRYEYVEPCRPHTLPDRAINREPSLSICVSIKWTACCLRCGWSTNDESLAKDSAADLYTSGRLICQTVGDALILMALNWCRTYLQRGRVAQIRWTDRGYAFPLSSFLWHV